jgi:8-oxo-dGTP pyrophosphatase MutT (NUDIX family)
VDPDLAAFLAAHPPHAEVRDDWPLDPVAPLLARLGLADELPPPTGRSSIHGIVLRGDGHVLVVHPATPTGSIAHVLVGGRPEVDEVPEATLRREVGEEAGWHVEPVAVIGYRRFTHLGPPHPQLADRGYPDFVQVVFAVRAEAEDRSLLLPGEAPTAFVPAAWALQVTRPAERPLLQRAIEVAGPDRSPTG